MTAQFGEKLILDDEEVTMTSEPLESYFNLNDERPKFLDNCTALWRGYVGHWEIIDKHLYLVNINGQFENGEDVLLENIFPGYADRVFAHWYSGTVRIPEGKVLEYVHMGYGSTYERDLFLKFKKGVMVSSETKNNDNSKN